MLSPEFTELLEEIQASGKVVSIRFRSDNDNIINLKSRIVQLSTIGENGFLKASNGAIISVKRLVEVDGIPAQFMA